MIIIFHIISTSFLIVLEYKISFRDSLLIKATCYRSFATKQNEKMKINLTKVYNADK
jgi:hypothetical protein